MRKIEFRGKAKDTGKWVYGDLIHKHGQVFIRSYNKNEMRDILVIPETVGQFTGFYDIKNKKIYEGDIIEWIGYYPHLKYYDLVVFDTKNGQFRCHNTPCLCSHDIGGDCSVRPKVAGNKWDNPKLLKKIAFL